MLFILFLSFYKMFYANQFIFFILWNFHYNTCEQCCLLSFYYFSKHSTWITMSESDYDNLSDNEKSQKFIKFDKNISDKCCNFLSCINKNRDMLQVRQKIVIQKEMKISQNLQKFQTNYIIKFTSENVWIHVNSRKNWNYKNSSTNSLFSS